MRFLYIFCIDKEFALEYEIKKKKKLWCIDEKKINNENYTKKIYIYICF